VVVAVPFLINIMQLWRENDNTTHTHTPREMEMRDNIIHQLRLYYLSLRGLQLCALW
jgi:hypothetical protein